MIYMTDLYLNKKIDIDDFEDVRTLVSMKRADFYDLFESKYSSIRDNGINNELRIKFNNFCELLDAGAQIYDNISDIMKHLTNNHHQMLGLNMLELFKEGRHEFAITKIKQIQYDVWQ